jgi:Holliday junction resolvase RusA-like endonuclease
VSPHIPKLEPIITGLRCAIALDLVLPPYKTVKTPWPKGDIDNYEKAVWDIITKKKHIWKDDIQVCLSITGKRFTEDGEDPHAAVYIREIL